MQYGAFKKKKKTLKNIKIHPLVDSRQLHAIHFSCTIPQPTHKQQHLKLPCTSNYPTVCLYPPSKDPQPAGVPTFFLENISLQQVNITDHPNVNHTHVRQTQPGATARWYPEYTRADIDNTRLGMIWHESDLKRSDAWATTRASQQTAIKWNIPGPYTV